MYGFKGLCINLFGEFGGRVTLTEAADHEPESMTVRKTLC